MYYTGIISGWKLVPMYGISMVSEFWNKAVIGIILTFQSFILPIPEVYQTFPGLPGLPPPGRCKIPRELKSITKKQKFHCLWFTVILSDIKVFSQLCSIYCFASSTTRRHMLTKWLINFKHNWIITCSCTLYFVKNWLQFCC